MDGTQDNRQAATGPREATKVVTGKEAGADKGKSGKGKEGKESKEAVQAITPQAVDFSRWYLDVIQKADLMDYAPVRGCIVFKPEGYALWEACQAGLDRRFKETGHRNAYFPTLIPASFLEKEKEHVEGFNPELPWVTEAGGEKLEEPLALRPTSETIIGSMYAQWIHSYRDLPVLINQWANVFRWEKRTLPFLRTTEFLWQEGHTAHATEEEARAETMRMLGVYTDFVQNDLAIPVFRGQKTPSEKFAGAVETYSIEAMMKDGKAVQAGTSHYLGTNFAESFGIRFLDQDNQLRPVHTTSWGASTRLLGCIVMVHGDDRGLVLPPKIAPTQVVIIPILGAQEREAVLNAAHQLYDQLRAAGVRVKLDDREGFRPGWKFNEYEMRGVPLRIEVGPRDLAAGVVTVGRRDTLEKGQLALNAVTTGVKAMLEEVQANLFRKAQQFQAEHTSDAETLADLEQLLETKGGFVLAGWCGEAACEAKVKEQTKATSRNMPLEIPGHLSVHPHAHCLVCGRPAIHQVWFARAY
ncbi:MAG: proline--tRNA ligase [Limnochordaceae bacterium]|nr:proline--tRNA ligase [Limnochordaceae bacterium]